MMAPLRLAFQALAANKLRSALTMLGNIIGVTCVVALINIGISGRERIQNELSSVGQNLVFVHPRYNAEAENPRERWRPLEYADVKAIQDRCPTVAELSPLLGAGGKVGWGNQHVESQVVGVWPEFLSIRGYKISEGHCFTMADVSGASKVCVIGKTIADKLFGGLDPLGQSLRINSQQLTVIGVMAEKGTFLNGEDQDKLVLAPFGTVQQYLSGWRRVDVIFVAARSREEIPKMKEEVRAAIRQSHKLAANKPDDVEVADLGEIAKMVDRVIYSATALLAAIALISLLVGGIGIMNIMIVSVTERTREIGLRMAVGAPELSILLQFLVEAVVLSSCGGMVGVGCGVGLSALASLLLKWPMTLSIFSVIVAVVFSAAIGIFFGLYPAWRASKLDPIVALRHE
ncbi:MAG TPA: ABC transporter permease [Planctomycetota bacterium]|jgi:putative ABC transport system permease protein